MSIKHLQLCPLGGKRLVTLPTEQRDPYLIIKNCFATGRHGTMPPCKHAEEEEEEDVREATIIIYCRKLNYTKLFTHFNFPRNTNLNGRGDVHIFV